MKKKYLFFDIDGTLTNNETKEIVPSAKIALDKLQEAGHFVAIATGRAHYKARGFMDEVGLHNMVCCGGSALVIDDELVVNTPLERDKAIAIYKQARSLGYGALVAIDDSIDVYDVDDRFRQQCGERKEPTRYLLDASFDIDKVENIFKLYISIPREEEARMTLKNTLGNLRFVEAYLMFQHDRKKDGILDMMKHLQAPIEDVVVFGDDYNDLVMFDDAWYSVAMGNACDALKKKAKYITDRNVDDGIYNACIKHGWIKE